jgi:alpha-glucan, water dikinase
MQLSSAPPRIAQPLHRKSDLLLPSARRAPLRARAHRAPAPVGPVTTNPARLARAGAVVAASAQKRGDAAAASSAGSKRGAATPAAAATASAVLAAEQAALVEHHVATVRYDSGPTEVSVSRLLPASGGGAAAADDGQGGYVVRVSLPSSGAFDDGGGGPSASASEGDEVLLHWGVDDWGAPGAKLAASAAPGTRDVGDAAQTPFTVSSDGSRATAELRFSADEAPARVVFVLRLAGSGGERWVNNNGPGFSAQLKTPSVANLATKAVSAEATAGHWTLLDRFRLATELLSASGAAAAAAAGLPYEGGARRAAQRSADELAAFVFTWLRLSSQRVLPWGRKGAGGYQPKDMSWTQRSLAEAASALAQQRRHGGDDGDSRGDSDATTARFRMFARWLAADLPRGGGNGDDVRLGILNVMRDGGIREGHRPGHDEPFLEQWHQKLHQNTDPSDVAIGEAYCAYLRSGGDEGEWWRVLWEVGRLDAEALAAMPRPITHVPHNLPHLLGPAQHYLWILKTVHSGAELDSAAEMCKGHLNEHDRWQLFDLLSNRDAWWAGGKAVELREAVAGVVAAGGGSAPRDLLLLDAALDGFARRHLGRADLRGMSVRDRVGVAALALRNAALSCEDGEVRAVARQWARLQSELPPGEGDDAVFGGGDQNNWPLAALAAVRRASLALAAFADDVRMLVQPQADRFGSAGGFLEGVDAAYIEAFAEEAIRGSAAFSPAAALASLEPDLRRAAGLPAWTLVSQPPPASSGASSVSTRGVAGVVRRVADLAEVQGGAFGTAAGEALPTVLVADQVGGSEDIPLGVAAVITRGATDVLSHVAIRARAQRVLFACCGDDEEWAAVLAACGASEAAGGNGSKANEKTAVDLVVSAEGQVVAERADYAALAAAASSSSSSSADQMPPPLQLPAPKKTDDWVLGEASFGGVGGGLVGGKAARLAELRAKLPDWLNVPRGVALPFGTFERVLAHPSNAAAKEEAVAPLRARLDAAAAAADAGKAASSGLPSADLAALRGAVSGEDVSCPPLMPPAELVQALAREAGAAGIILASEKSGWEAWAAAALAAASPPPLPDSLRGVWRAVLAVWASKWTDRAWLSRRTRRVNEQALSMSVLLQRVEPARYAFVAHTADPVTGERAAALQGGGGGGGGGGGNGGGDNVVHGEMVVGMGEVLVSAAPGSAFRFEAVAPTGTGALASSEGEGEGEGAVRALSLPSKRLAAWAAGGGSGGGEDVGASALIARSDANGEDLEAFAGAGLYDSVPVTPLRYVPADYADEPLVWDSGARAALARRVARAASAVEAAMGGGAPQDVEGVVDAQGRVTVVQTRPQVVEKH